MNRTIDFHHKPFLGTVEVHNEGPDTMLSAELASCQPAIPECLPQQSFSSRRLLAEDAGTLYHAAAKIGWDA